MNKYDLKPHAFEFKNPFKKDKYINFKFKNPFESVIFNFLVLFILAFLALILISLNKRNTMNELICDEEFYVLADIGDEVLIPIFDPADKLYPGIIEDYLGIACVLGNPNYSEHSLTNFVKGELWLLVEYYKKPLRRFILVLKWNPNIKEKWLNQISEIKTKFENSDYLLEGGFFKISEPDYYLYLVKDKSSKNGSDPVSELNYDADMLCLEVNNNPVGSPANASLFASAKKDGKLVITIDTSSRVVIKCEKQVEKGCISDRVYYTNYGYSIMPVILNQKEVTCRPELYQALPKLY